MAGCPARNQWRCGLCVGAADLLLALLGEPTVQVIANEPRALLAQPVAGFRSEVARFASYPPSSSAISTTVRPVVGLASGAYASSSFPHAWDKHCAVVTPWACRAWQFVKSSPMRVPPKPSSTRRGAFSCGDSTSSRCQALVNARTKRWQY